jgi:hypothetical protein
LTKKFTPQHIPIIVYYNTDGVLMRVRSLFFTLAITGFNPIVLFSKEIPPISSVEVKNKDGRTIGFLRDTNDFLSNNNPDKERYTLFIPQNPSQCSYVFKEPIPKSKK